MLVMELIDYGFVQPASSVYLRPLGWNAFAVVARFMYSWLYIVLLNISGGLSALRYPFKTIANYYTSQNPAAAFWSISKDEEGDRRYQISHSSLYRYRNIEVPQ